MTVFRRLVAVLGVASLTTGMVACGAEQEEDAEVSDNAFRREQVENDPILKALKVVGDDVSKYDVSVRGIGVPIPSASSGTNVNGFSTRGLDWFKNPAVSYPDNKSWDQGTETGKKCQWAAIFRFHAIFADPPAEAREMLELEGGMWRGSFWSWIDDYASTDDVGEPTPAYAWSSGLWKWIGASGANDTCKLPTKAMVAGMMKSCLDVARANDGDPKGCRMPRFNPAVEAAYPYPRSDADAGDASADGSADASADARADARTDASDAGAD